MSVLLADVELRVALGRALVGERFGLTGVEADGGFKDDENVIAVSADTGDDLRDLLRVRDGVIDGFAKLLHEAFEIRVHKDSPRTNKIRCWRQASGYYPGFRARQGGKLEVGGL
jgi:hypothetical protein